MKRNLDRHRWRTCLIVLSIVPLLNPAHAADLFLPLADDPSAELATGRGESGLSPRAHRVAIARDLLTITRTQVEHDGTGTLRLSVDAGVNLDVVVEHTAPTRWGYSLSGWMTGETPGSVTLVVHDEVVAGLIWTPAGSYEVAHLDGGVHAVREVNEGTSLKCGTIAIADLPASAETSGGGTDDGSVVDILVVWAPAAEARIGGEDEIKAEIDLAIAFTNDAFRRSGVFTSLNLVGAQRVDYEEADPLTDLHRLADPQDGYLDGVPTLGDSLGADLVHLFNGRGGGGWAYVGGGYGTSGSVFAFAHEVGHNFGVRHRRGAEVIQSYEHAFVDGSLDVRCAHTMMNHGISQCGGPYANGSGRMVPYYSSPALWDPLNGRRLGVSRFESMRGENGPADAVLAINRARHKVANFRPRQTDRSAGGWGRHWQRTELYPRPPLRTAEGKLRERVLPLPDTVSSNALVNIPDTNLRRAVEAALDKRSDEAITQGDMASLTTLTASPRVTYLDQGRGVRDLSGMEYAINMTSLDAPSGSIDDLSPLRHLRHLNTLVLPSNYISDLTPLEGLDSLSRLELGDNYISDLKPLAGLQSLKRLSIHSNRISNLSPLRNLLSLEFLSLSLNQIHDLAPLAELDLLQELWLGENYISDLMPLANLESLAYLQLSSNEVTELEPLVANSGIGNGDVLDVVHNPLNTESIRIHIPALVERGVEVNGPRVPEPNDEEWSAKDPRLYAVVQEALEDSFTIHTASPVTVADLSKLLRLLAPGRGIVDLAGLESATGLVSLNLSDNAIVDVSVLTHLNGLSWLFLEGNGISDITSLAGLSSLKYLLLSSNEIEDAAPLSGLNGLSFLALDDNRLLELPALSRLLQILYLDDNSISNIASLENLGAVRELRMSGNLITSIDALAHMSVLYLHLNDNQVSDISPLNLEPLVELHIRNNAVRDLSPLLNAEKLAMVDVRDNPLSDESLRVLAELRDAGVTVLAGESVPYFPAGGTADREGFVRVINRSETAGEVFIEAVDDAGVRRGPVPVRMAGRAALHFNSSDLENGNRSKGILTGIGRPTAGDWRLELVSALDFEALSYVRSEDGFVTAMHDVATRPMLPFVNPGDNDQQRSLVRVVNTEGERGLWTSGGYDDTGRWHWMPSGVEVGPSRAVTFTSAELENARGLGDGQGKWWLRTRGFPWLSMSLLESPTGHLTNLTTVPDNVTALADGTHRHRVPLFLEAGGAREGFLRVINRSDAAGTVAIEAVDDAGNARGPIRVEVAALGTLHFNSGDLESGNADKGLAGGVGLGEGDWRLALTSELELHALAYIRTADGFVTAMHDVAPRGEDGSHRVVFFNPGSNRNQVSMLRLVNDGEGTARVTITGIDDAGGDSGTVTLSVPARRAFYFTSAELEAGDEGLEGSLGDGAGKWRLRVDADAPLTVMSLLESPTGHLANVSTGTAD